MPDEIMNCVASDSLGKIFFAFCLFRLVALRVECKYRMGKLGKSYSAFL